ncbi:hypothetical protein JXO52_08805 [bacterium]|nr:hypothetical protein [bacterium]
MSIYKQCVTIIVLLLPMIITAQTRDEAVQELRREIAALKMTSDSKFETLEHQLKQILTDIQKTKEKDAMQELLEKARILSQKKKSEEESLQRKFHSGLRQQSALNPNISMSGDYYAAYGTSDSDYNRIPSEYTWGTGRFFLREMEMGLQSPLDPFSRGKVFLSYGREGVSLEEGYIEVLNFPLNINVKIGEYKTQFGKLNRYHDHALPQFDRPLVLVNFFGVTSLKGFGVAANVLLPSMTAHVNELDIDVISGGVGHSFTDAGKHNLIYVAHYKNYYDLNRSTYLEFGLSGATGYNDPGETLRTLVAGGDLTLKWTPPGRAKYRGIEWRTELLWSEREAAGPDVSAWGFFSSLQAKLGVRWFGSIRADYSQLPYDSELEEKGVTICFDYWQTEFVFYRFQYSRLERNFEESDTRVIFQTNWAMGPHKHDAY